MIIPILQLESILLSSLQGDLTDHDVLTFQDNILQKVKSESAKGVIIDLMGLDIVDSFMVRVINETAGMVRLLGAEIVVCGMGPSVALTLSEMGRDLVSTHTTLNLDFALEKMRVLLDPSAPFTKKDRALKNEEPELEISETEDTQWQSE